MRGDILALNHSVLQCLLLDHLLESLCGAVIQSVRSVNHISCDAHLKTPCNSIRSLFGAFYSQLFLINRFLFIRYVVSNIEECLVGAYLQHRVIARLELA